MAEMRIAVTGATGFIGSHVVEALCARGHEVVCLARNPEKARVLDGLALRVVYGDLDSPEALASLVKGQDAVIHLAGLTKAPRLDEFVRVNVGGTERLIEAIRRSCPDLGRLVYFSSAETMGPSPGGSALTEDVAPKPFSAYAKSKVMAEKCLDGIRDKVAVTIVRPPAVYGPRDRDVAILFRLLSRGLQPVVSPTPVFSVIYVKNLAEGICKAIESPLRGARSYFFTDGAPWSWFDFGCLIARALGKKPLQLRIPLFVVRAIAHAAGFITTITGKSGILSREKIEEMIRSWVVSDARARTELGYSPRFSTEQGIAETATWYRQAGWI